MASSPIEILKNIYFDQEKLQILGWKAKLNLFDECLFIKRENSTSFIRIDTNFKIIGVRNKQKVFEIALKKLTFEGISKILVLLEPELPDADPHEDYHLLDLPKLTKSVAEPFQIVTETNNNTIRIRNSRKPTHLKSFSCCICDKRFYRKEKLDEHQTRDHKGHIWACNFCPKVFRFISQLTLHEKVTHNIEETDKIISKPDNTEEKAFCKVCKTYLYNSNSGLKRHRQTMIHKQNLEIATQMQVENEQGQTIEIGSILKKKTDEIISKPEKKGEKAYCEVCKTYLFNSNSKLERHRQTKMHKQNLEIATQMQVVNEQGPTDKIPKPEKNGKKAYCEVCQTYLYNSNSDVKRHRKTKTHKQNLKIVTRMQVENESDLIECDSYNSQESEMLQLRVDSTDTEQDPEEIAPMTFEQSRDMYEILKAENSSETLKIVLKKIDTSKYLL